jgi:hypothetical protein
MTFELVSTQSWNVLGTFEDESVARDAVHLSVERGAAVHDLVVYVTDDVGHAQGEYSDVELAAWADIRTRHASAAGV